MTKFAPTKAWFAACLLIISTIACNKHDCEEIEDDRLEATATIIDSGSPALDGCGWLIRTNGTTYSPDNLPEAFKLNNIQVKIIYTISEAKFQCGFNNSGPNFIHLYDIKR
ncbi:hypothetical protein [Mucilaginibacter sp. PAMB04168]|uniref:hypothetical protein n=1 Tax=Mucilaginibacter sp. PAMB04168 TaxID=3138567 RepID=UPI0031F6D77A